MSRDETTLLDIAQAARLILAFKQGMDKDSFLRDLKTQSAILHQLLIMGEAVKRLSTDFRVQRSEIPWTPIARMRDKLIHAYDIVDFDEVWKTVDSDVPSLLSQLGLLLPKDKQ